MNPRTRRLRRLRRGARKRAQRGLVLVRDLRTGKQFLGKLSLTYPSYTIRVHPKKTYAGSDLRELLASNSHFRTLHFPGGLVLHEEDDGSVTTSRVRYDLDEEPSDG